MNLSKKLSKTLILLTFILSANAFSSEEKPKALIIISSATELALKSPQGQESISVGFFLVELAKILETFENRYDFVFATPDGRAPQLDINGLDLNSHVQGAKAPFVQAFSNVRNNDFFFESKIDEALGLSLNVDRFRHKRAEQFERRERELKTAMKHLGKIPFSRPLPNTHPEVLGFYEDVETEFDQLEEKEFYALWELIQKNKDPEDELKFRDFDFVFLPGGHAPMVDFVDNPYLGEVLNSFHENGALISAICHGPIAMQSARFRVGENGEVRELENFPMKGARLTTVSTFEENLVLALGYPRVPGFEKTRLEYFVDQELNKIGFKVEYGSKMRFDKFQLYPGFPKVVFDGKYNVLTGNGPQSMDKLVQALQLHLVK